MLQDLEIRLAVPDDADDIYRINRDSLGYDFPLELTRERLAAVLASDANRIYVASVKHQVAGYIHAADYDCTYSGSLKNILALAVVPARQGQGIGRVLLAAVENWACQCGCCGVRLVSSFSRTGAHQFYLRCGYVNRKDQKNFVKLFASDRSAD